MAVNSVNNNNSRPSIVPAMLVGGAGIGATMGYTSKPFIKNGDLPDTFIGRLAEVNHKINLKYTEKAYAEENKALENYIKSGKLTDLPDGIKNDYIAGVESITGKKFKDVPAKELKEIASQKIANNKFVLDISKKYTYPVVDLQIKKLKGIYIPDDATMDEVKIIIKDNVNTLGIIPPDGHTVESAVEKYIGGRKIPDIKKGIAEETKYFESQLNSSKNSVRTIFSILYDADKNKFVLPAGADDEIKDAFNLFKKETNLLKRKTALSYGAGGAMLMGLAAYAYERFFSK